MQKLTSGVRLSWRVKRETRAKGAIRSSRHEVLKTSNFGPRALSVLPFQPVLHVSRGYPRVDRVFPQPGRCLAQARRVDLVHLVCFVHLVSLVQPNKPENQINKRNKPGFVPEVLHPVSVRCPCANNVGCLLYIQILAQYNSEVLHACCCR